MKDKKLIIIIAVALTLFACCICSIMALVIAKNTAAARVKSRDTQRLKALETLRNGLADFYTKYNEEANICVMSDNEINIVAKDSGCLSSQKVKLTINSKYRFEQIEECYINSSDKIIRFTHFTNTRTLTYCGEDSEKEILNY